MRERKEKKKKRHETNNPRASLFAPSQCHLNMYSNDRPGRLFIRFLTQCSAHQHGQNQKAHTHTQLQIHTFIHLLIRLHSTEQKPSVGERERKHNQLTAHRIGYCIQITKIRLSM